VCAFIRLIHNSGPLQAGPCRNFNGRVLASAAVRSRLAIADMIKHEGKQPGSPHPRCGAPAAEAKSASFAVIRAVGLVALVYPLPPTPIVRRSVLAFIKIATIA
jgi:hypothetical protein